MANKGNSNDQEQLQIIIDADAQKMRNELSKCLKIIQTEANKVEKAFNKMLPELKQFNKEATRMSDSMTKASKSQERLKDATEKATRAQKSFNETVKKSNNDLDKTERTVKNIKRDMAGLKGDVKVNVRKTETPLTTAVPIVPLAVGAGAMVGAMANKYNNKGFKSNDEDKKNNKIGFDTNQKEKDPIGFKTTNMVKDTTGMVKKHTKSIRSQMKEMSQSISKEMGGIKKGIPINDVLLKKAYAKMGVIVTQDYENLIKHQKKLQEELGAVRPVENISFAKAVPKNEFTGEVGKNGYTKEDFERELKANANKTIPMKTPPLWKDPDVVPKLSEKYEKEKNALRDLQNAKKAASKEEIAQIDQQIAKTEESMKITKDYINHFTKMKQSPFYRMKNEVDKLTQSIIKSQAPLSLLAMKLKHAFHRNIYAGALKVGRGIIYVSTQTKLGRLALKSYANVNSLLKRRLDSVRPAIERVKSSLQKKSKSAYNAAKASKKLCIAVVNKVKALKNSFKAKLKDVSASKTLTKALDKLKNKTKEVSKETKRAGGGFKEMLKNMAGIAGITALVGGAGKAIMQGMADIENDNIFRTAFGPEMTKEMYAWSESAIHAFGMPQSELRRLSAEFVLFTGNMLGSRKEGIRMGKALTELTRDFGSFYNVDTARASQIIMSSMSGEMEAIRRYGVNLSEANVKNYAYANGIARIGEELTESQKVQARYGSMMAQLSHVHGDFADTINSPANQLRILQAQLRETMTLLGQAFQPILSIVLPVLNALVAGLNKVIQVFGMFMQALFGVEMTVKGTGGSMRTMSSDTAAVADNAGRASRGMNAFSDNASRARDAVKDTVKEFKGLMGFDEINLLPSTEKSDGGSGGSGGSGGGAGGGAGLPSIPQIDWTEGEIPKIEIPKWIQDAADAVKKLAATLFDPIKEAWDKVGPKLIEQMKIAWDNIKNVFEQGKETLAAIWRNGGSDIFGNLWEILFNIGVICGRVFNETLIPIVQGFLDLLNPEKTPGAKGFLKIMQDITQEVSEFVEYLAGDGFVYVDQFVKALLGFGALYLIAKAVVTVMSGILSFIGAIKGVIAVIAAFVGVSVSTVALVVAAIVFVIATLVNMWNRSEELRVKWGEVWGYIKEFVGMVAEALGVIIGGIIRVIMSIWTHALKPIWDKFSDVFAEIGIIVADFLNFIMPIINEICRWLGPVIVVVVEALVAAFQKGFTFMAKIVNSCLEEIRVVVKMIRDIFGGLIDFVVGVFTGNWERAWKGVSNIFGGIFNGLVGLAKKPINAIIGLLNGAISGLNMLIKGANMLPGVDIPSIGKIPRLATGGIVNGPTLAMIGDSRSGGSQREAVVPLGQDEAWSKPIAERIMRKIDNSNSSNNDVKQNDRPIEVVLQVGATKLGKVVIDSINKVHDQEGRVLLNI